MSTITYDRDNTSKTYVIKINLNHCELKSQWSTVYDLLFARRYKNDSINLIKLINTIAISTRLRRSFNDPNNNEDVDTICIFYRFDYTDLPRFESDLLSVFSESEDPRKFRHCNKSDYLYLLSTNVIRLLQPAEQTYLRNIILNYIKSYSQREHNTVKILK